MMELPKIGPKWHTTFPEGQSALAVDAPWPVRMRPLPASESSFGFDLAPAQPETRAGITLIDIMATVFCAILGDSATAALSN